jgi:hypothetical protein
MTNELKKIEPIDSFDAFEHGIEGEVERAGAEAFVIFTNEAKFVLRGSTAPLPSNMQYLVESIDRFEVQWVDGKPQMRQLKPGEKFRDIKKLNDEAPKSEWSEGPGGELRGPWENEYLVRLLNPVTMDRITFATKTVGGGIAVRELVDRTKRMRRLRGENVFPVVTPMSVPWKTRYGWRQRPHFEPKRWVVFGAPESEVPVIEAPQAKPVPEPQAPRAYAPDRITSGPQPSAKAIAPQSIIPPSDDDLDDSIPF